MGTCPSESITVDLIKRYWTKLKESFIGKIFYLSLVSAKVKPGKWANIYWILFTLFSVTFITLTVFYGVTPWLKTTFWVLIGMFGLGEGVGVGWKVIDLFGRGGTYSEWNWWYIRHPLLRAAWGYTLSGMVMLYWHPIPGAILALWLTLHLALKGREAA